MFRKPPGIAHACHGRIAPRLTCPLYRPRLPQSTWKTALGRTYQSCSQEVSLPFGGTMLTLRPGRRIPDSNSEQGESKQHKGLVYEYESSSAAGKRFPAVSTVLKDSANKSSQYLLERWRRKEVELKGEEAVAIERKGRLGRGHEFHRAIELYLTQGRFECGESLHDWRSGEQLPEPIQGFWRSVLPVLDRIDEVYALETVVCHRHLGYAGTADCIARLDGNWALIDWKGVKASSRSRQAISQWYDYPLQLAAYLGAFNADPIYTKIAYRGVLVVAYDDGYPADALEISGKELEKAWAQFKVRLWKYREMQSAGFSPTLKLDDEG